MRLAFVLFTVALLVWAVATTVSCGKAGMITGGTVKHCDSLTAEQVAFVELGLVAYVCPAIKDETEYECTANMLAEGMRLLELRWLGRGIDYCVSFSPPED